MESRYRFGAIITFVAILIGAGWWYFSSASPPGSDSSQPEKEQSLEQTITDFRLTETTGPDERWVLEASEATRRGDKINLTSPQIFLFSGGDTVSTVRSDTGTYNTNARKMTFHSDVNVHHLAHDFRLKTEILNWNRSDGIVYTDSQVRILHSMGSLTAQSLEADLADESIQFKSDNKERLQLDFHGQSDTSF